MKFSNEEVRDLLKAWIAISVAFAILLRENNFLLTFILSALTVGIGFLAHELSHKFLAQKYRLWAEFRANNFMLILAIAMSFLGFIFIAPGAVMIRGHNIDYRKNGIISAAGPISSLILAILFLPLAFLGSGFLGMIGLYGYFINAWIGLFNLIPLWNFDGKKILDWNRIVYIILVIVALVLVFGRGFFG